MRRRWLAAGAGAARCSLALASPPPTCSWACRTPTRSPSPATPRTASSRWRSPGIGEGALLPARDPRRRRADPDRWPPRCAGVDGIHGAVAPRPSWRRGGTALVDAIPVPDGGSTGERPTRSTAVREAAHAGGADVRVGGGPAANDDFIDAVYGSFPLMVALIAIVDVHPARPRVPLAAAAAQGDRAEHPQRGGRVGRAGAGLAARLRLRG